MNALAFGQSIRMMKIMLFNNNFFGMKIQRSSKNRKLYFNILS